jgi:two-component system, NarL family, response regulator DevR
MTTVFIARRGAPRARASQAQLEASRELKVLGLADTLYRAKAALPALNPDALLIDLRLEDGAALSLVLGLREKQTERPKVLLIAADAADPLLFATLCAGADAYLLEADLANAASALRRMTLGEATMAAPIAAQALQFFNEPLTSAAPINARALDWHSHAANPMRLSPGECWLLRRVAEGSRCAELAARMAISVEALGRRVGNVYRKLSWDVRSGSLSLLAA